MTQIPKVSTALSASFCQYSMFSIFRGFPSELQSLVILGKVLAIHRDIRTYAPYNFSGQDRWRLSFDSKDCRSDRDTHILHRSPKSPTGRTRSLFCICHRLTLHSRPPPSALIESRPFSKILQSHVNFTGHAYGSYQS